MFCNEGRRVGRSFCPFWKKIKEMLEQQVTVHSQLNQALTELGKEVLDYSSALRDKTKANVRGTRVVCVCMWSVVCVMCVCVWTVMCVCACGQWFILEGLVSPFAHFLPKPWCFLSLMNACTVHMCDVM